MIDQSSQRMHGVNAGALTVTLDKAARTRQEKSAVADSGWSRLLRLRGSGSVSVLVKVKPGGGSAARAAQLLVVTSSDHWDAATAARYDETSAFMFEPEVLGPAVVACR